MSINSDQKIDAVITWVDGNDPVHRKKRAEMACIYNAKQRTSSSLSTAGDETRFIENGELKYCLASIRTFAPWIHKIYLVTDNQVPPFLTPELRDRYKDRKSTRLNSSHVAISYAVFCLKKQNPDNLHAALVPAQRTAV